MRKIETLEMALERIKELEAENQKLNEELEYYRNRKVSGRQKHNDKGNLFIMILLFYMNRECQLLKLQKKKN